MKKIDKTIKHNQGQIAIIVLLASAILLTLGLSASRKTVTDTKVDMDEELLKEAFNTAESGINNYLTVGTTSYSDSSGNSASVTSSSIGGNNSLSSDGSVLVNTPHLFWLVNHNPNGDIGATYYSDLTIRLGVKAGYTGSLKIDYYYRNGAAYGVTRSGFNFNGSSSVNGFTATSNDFVDLTLTNSPLLLIVTPLGVTTDLILTGGAAFPLQGEELTSVGTAGNGVKTQIRTKNIYQLPSFFNDAVTARSVVQ